jgi:murein DD-endopeptidase MepM/ murein hydrolase activator NlpD
MISSQFSFRRRVFVKRVASIFSIGLAVSLAACSSQGISFEETASFRDSHGSTVPIPSEPVYGYSDTKTAASSGNGAPFRSAATDTGYPQSSIQRTSLAPVRTASYDSPGSGSYVGGSYAMQPVLAHGADSAVSKNGGSSAPAARYAQARPSYYGSRSYDDRPSYSDYKPYRVKSYSEKYDGAHEAPEPVHHGGYYVVREGDTLYGIAKRFGLTTVELAGANGITGSTIYAGQKLRIPGGPTYTGTSRRGDYVRHDSRGPAYDEHKAPPPGYRSRHRGGYGPSYADHPPRGRSYAEADDDRDDENYDRPSSYARVPPYRDHSEQRYARPYDKRASHDRGDSYARRYRKPEGAYDSYTVQRGDTLYDIAQRNGLSHRELAAYNDIPLSATLFPGQVLHIPKGRGYELGRKQDGGGYEHRGPGSDHLGNGYSRRVPYSQNTPKPKKGDAKGERKLARKAAPNRAGRKPSPSSDAKPAAAAPSEKKAEPILAAARDVNAANGTDGGVADKKDCQSLLAQPVARSGTTFREPVQGLIVAKFGSKDNGSFNDGIDFSVPKGTPVKAAENGVVAYVGNELPGFGNLILVRHADGYVTAYAHNDEVLVRRCEIVKRGQVISKAGATGEVTKPQLHFELRKDSKAVDPEAFFSRS